MVRKGQMMQLAIGLGKVGGSILVDIPAALVNSQGKRWHVNLPEVFAKNCRWESGYVWNTKRSTFAAPVDDLRIIGIFLLKLTLFLKHLIKSASELLSYFEAGEKVRIVWNATSNKPLLATIHNRSTRTKPGDRLIRTYQWFSRPTYLRHPALPCAGIVQCRNTARQWCTLLKSRHG